jgi:miniconductance mechanosensitive channel
LAAGVWRSPARNDSPVRPTEAAPFPTFRGALFSPASAAQLRVVFPSPARLEAQEASSPMESFAPWLTGHPFAAPIVGLLALWVAAWLADFVARRVLARFFSVVALRSATSFDDHLVDNKVPLRLAHIAPVAVVQFGIAFVPGLPPELLIVVPQIALSVAILMGLLALTGALRAVNTAYEHKHRDRHGTIKGYTQLATLVIYVLGAILIVATLINRSPLILISGLGAMAAVLLLVFQDTLLSLVASVQISSQDMLRVGDWIEMPNLNADGDVIDIALHTVRVQNWDKTISTIPTRRLISDPFKNWRGMSDAGGRRIKRALDLDTTSVEFLDEAATERLRRFRLLRPYLAQKEADLAAYNAGLENEGQNLPLNARRLTNLGTFRAYVVAYLKAHPGIHQDMTLIVRQLPPSATGLPIEIYCFTTTTAWSAYEDIQSDLFDHLIAILPAFGLRLFQSTTGADLRQAMTTLTVRGTPDKVVPAHLMQLLDELKKPSARSAKQNDDASSRFREEASSIFVTNFDNLQLSPVNSWQVNVPPTAFRQSSGERQNGPCVGWQAWPSAVASATHVPLTQEVPPVQSASLCCGPQPSPAFASAADSHLPGVTMPVPGLQVRPASMSQGWLLLPVQFPPAVVSATQLFVIALPSHAKPASHRESSLQLVPAPPGATQWVTAPKLLSAAHTSG